MARLSIRLGGVFQLRSGARSAHGRKSHPHLPLAEFGWYEHSTTIALNDLPPFAAAKDALNWQAAWDYSGYQQAFNQVQSIYALATAIRLIWPCPLVCSENLTERLPLALLQSFNPPLVATSKQPIALCLASAQSVLYPCLARASKLALSKAQWLAAKT